MLPQLSAATICCGLTVSSDTRTVSSCILTVSSQASSRAYLAISSLTVVLACSNFCLTVKDYQDERDAKLNKFVLLCLCTTSVSRCASVSTSVLPSHYLTLCLCTASVSVSATSISTSHCLCLCTASVSPSLSLSQPLCLCTASVSRPVSTSHCLTLCLCLALCTASSALPAFSPSLCVTRN